MIDLHLHSYFSMDSEEKLQNILNKGIELNIKTLALTDHIDLYSFDSSNAYQFKIDEYFEAVSSYKEKYKDQIELLIGVEIGIQPDICKINDQLVSSYPFDFVIGSIHAVKHMDIFMDKYLENYKPEEALKYYYEEMLISVENTKNFDVLGHIDYIDRYFPDKSLIPNYETYSELITPILKEIISSNRGIEINTAGIRKKLGYMNPKNEILQLYRDLGGEIITIGSDAHFAKDIGANIDDAISILKNMGFTHTSKYIGRKKADIEL